MRKRKIDADRLWKVIEQLLNEEDDRSAMMMVTDDDMRQLLLLARDNGEIFFEGPVDAVEQKYTLFERHTDDGTVLWQQWGNIYNSLGDALAHASKQREGLAMKDIVILPLYYENELRKLIKKGNE